MSVTTHEPEPDMRVDMCTTYGQVTQDVMLTCTTDPPSLASITAHLESVCALAKDGQLNLVPREGKFIVALAKADVTVARELAQSAHDQEDSLVVITKLQLVTLADSYLAHFKLQGGLDAVSTDRFAANIIGLLSIMQGYYDWLYHLWGEAPPNGLAPVHLADREAKRAAGWLARLGGRIWQG